MHQIRAIPVCQITTCISLVNFGAAFLIADFGHLSLRLPVDFWKMLHAEYGIVVYPSALTDCIAAAGLGTSQTFSEIYSEHIGLSLDSNLCLSISPY